MQTQPPLTLTGQLLMDDPAGTCKLVPGTVRVVDGRISEIMPGEISANADAGNRNTMIAPGFIDAHVHLPQFDIIGAHSLTLLKWLTEFTFPAEQKWRDPDYAKGMTQRVLRQLLSVGTTGICAYATVHHAATATAIEVARELGIRGVIGQVLMDREAPESLCRPANQLLEETATLADRFPQSDRMSTAVTPRFAITCSEALLRGAGRLALEKQLPIQSHVAETTAECERVKALFGGRRYLQVYDDCGLLTDRSIYAHGVHLNQLDRQRLAASRSTIAHCPTANTFLQSGIMSLAAMRRSGVRIALGSDIGAGYERSMVRVARSMIESASIIGDPAPSAAYAWHAITAGNADAVGWPDAGRLRDDAVADLVVIEPDIPWLDSPVDPLSMLMFAWDDRWIKQTIVKGKAYRFPCG